MSIPNKPTYTENLKAHALTWFTANPSQSSLVSRTMSRIPVFFIAMAAGIVELSHSASRFIKRTFDSSPPATQTQVRTQSVALEIFSMLWNIPDAEAVMNAKLVQAISSDPYLKPGSTHNIPIRTGQFVGIERFDPKTMITAEASLREQARTLPAILQAQGISEAAFLQDPVHILETISAESAEGINRNFEGLKNHFTSLVFNIENISNSENLSPADLAKVKKYLLDNHHTPCFNLDLIAKIPNSDIQNKLKTLFREKVGSLAKIQHDADNKLAAFVAFDAFCKENHLEGFTIENIEKFKRVHGDLGHFRELVSELKEFVVSQLSKDLNRFDVSIDIPGFHRQAFINEKIYTKPYFQNLSSAPKLMAEAYFEALLDYNKSQTSDTNQALKDTLSMIFAATQALEGELFPKVLVPSMRQSFETAKSKTGLPSDLHYMSMSQVVRSQATTVQKTTRNDNKVKIHIENGKATVSYDIKRSVMIQSRRGVTYFPYSTTMRVQKQGSHLNVRLRPSQILHAHVFRH